MLAVLQLLAKAGPGARYCLFCDDGASDSKNTSPASASIADNASQYHYSGFPSLRSALWSTCTSHQTRASDCDLSAAAALVSSYSFCFLLVTCYLFASTFQCHWLAVPVGAAPDVIVLDTVHPMGGPWAQSAPAV